MTVPQLALTQVDRPPHWTDDAACRDADPGWFFAVDAALQQRALEVCEGCPVLVACREHAMTVRQVHGVWGGTTEKERRSIIRRQRRGAAAA